MGKICLTDFSPNVSFFFTLAQRFHTFSSIEIDVKFYFHASLWHLKRVWWMLYRPSWTLGCHGGVWKEKKLYWFSIWSWIRIVRTKKAWSIKGYLHYKTITSQNVSCDAQVKNFFNLVGKFCLFSRYSRFLHF